MFWHCAFVLRCLLHQGRRLRVADEPTTTNHFLLPFHPSSLHKPQMLALILPLLSSDIISCFPWIYLHFEAAFLRISVCAAGAAPRQEQNALHTIAVLICDGYGASMISENTHLTHATTLRKHYYGNRRIHRPQKFSTAGHQEDPDY